MRKLLAIALALWTSVALAGPPPIPPNAPQGPFGSATVPVTASGQFNLNSPNLSHYRAAIAKVRAGTGRGTVVLLGDSTTMGAGSGTSGNTNVVGAFPNNYPSAFAVMLNGFRATSFNSIFGDQNVVNALSASAYSTYDTRVTQPASWQEGGATTLGGNFFVTNPGSSTSTFSFTPAGVFDTIKYYYAKNTTLGSFTSNVDGGSSLGTVTTAGSQALGTSTFTVTKGTHTINIIPNGDGQVFLAGIIAYDSTTSAIDLIQAGWWGSTVSNWQNGTHNYDPLPTLQALAPVLTVIDLTINDSNNNGLAGLPTYITNMQNIITAAKVSGDCMLVVGVPSNTVNATNGTLDQYAAALQSLAITNGCVFLNTKTRWVSYAVTNPLMPYFDTLHPGKVGYQDFALEIFETLGNGGASSSFAQSPGIIYAGPVPTPSGSCAINTQLGGNAAGSFKANGACVAGTVILTFNQTALNGWACKAQDLTTVADTINQTAYTQTSVTFTGSMASADLVTFGPCGGF